jgi:hypothetical protein
MTTCISFDPMNEQVMLFSRSSISAPHGSKHACLNLNNTPYVIFTKSPQAWKETDQVMRRVPRRFQEKKGDLQTARMCGCADGGDGRKMEIRRSGPVPDKTRKIRQRCQLLCNLAYAHSGLASDQGQWHCVNANAYAHSGLAGWWRHDSLVHRNIFVTVIHARSAVPRVAREVTRMRPCICCKLRSDILARSSPPCDLLQ